MTNGNDCAYPADAKTQTEGGLTKREYFAAMAMRAMLSNHTLLKVITYVADINEIDWKEQLSLESCQVADKFIKALEEHFRFIQDQERNTTIKHHNHE